MHTNQQKIFDLAKKSTLKGLSLRAIGEKVNITNAQTVKFHLQRLVDQQILDENWQVRETERGIFRVPIYGTANCGPATFHAQNEVEGYLRVSSGVLGRESARNLIALRADGNSMNRAYGGRGIHDSDYVLVELKSDKTIRNGEYVVSLFDGCANIKKVVIDKEYVSFVSESSEDYPPLIVTRDEFRSGLVQVVGRVVKVIQSKRQVKN